MSTTRDPRLRKATVRRQQQCARCYSSRGLQAHHIVALADGGADDLSNLDALCGACHVEWHHAGEGNISYDTFKQTPPASVVLRMLADEQLAGRTIGEMLDHWLQARAGLAGIGFTREGSGAHLCQRAAIA